MERIAWIDNAKAFAMFCVVFGHVNGLFSHNIVGFSCVNEFIVSFNMALFVFLSGYTSHNGLLKITNRKKLFQYVKKISNRILLPLFTATILHCLIVKEVALQGGPWFLKMIFKIYLIASIFCFIIRTTSLGNIVVAYLLCFFVSIFFPDTGCVSEFCLMFIFGALCKEYDLIRRIENLNSLRKSMIIIFFSLIYILLIRYTHNFDFYKLGLHKLISINLIYIYIMRQIVAISAIFVIILLIIPLSKEYGSISKMGSDSLGLYIYHCLLLELYRENSNILQNINFGVYTWFFSIVFSIILWFLTLIIIKVFKAKKITKLIFLGDLK